MEKFKKHVKNLFHIIIVIIVFIMVNFIVKNVEDILFYKGMMDKENYKCLIIHTRRLK